jgi:hypothetical protein
VLRIRYFFLLVRRESQFLSNENMKIPADAVAITGGSIWACSLVARPNADAPPGLIGSFQPDVRQKIPIPKHSTANSPYSPYRLTGTLRPDAPCRRPKPRGIVSSISTSKELNGLADMEGMDDERSC